MSTTQDQNKGRRPLVNLAGKSYGYIAKATGHRKSMVHRWLTGQATPRKQADITALAKAIGMKSDALLLAIYRGRSA